MVTRDLRTYNYYTIGANDAYGQPQTSTEPAGQITMAIYTTSQGVQSNINYASANYIGLTNSPINDTYIIEYGAEKLKVLYVQPSGRYKQAFLVKL